MAQLDQITAFLKQELQWERYDDYCPNGLQVQGQAQVHRLVSGVTACEALIDAAIERGAHAILVHHGLFWKGDAYPVIGVKRRKLAKLLEHNISVWGVHLPLDDHPILGNNAQWAARLGWQVSEQRFGPGNLGWLGSLPNPCELDQVARDIETLTQRKPLVIEGRQRPIQRVAWCTGAAQRMIESLDLQRVDLYVSGEVSEPTFHFAKENGIAFIAAGHHATERYGVQAVGEKISHEFGLIHEFVDIENPV